MNCGLAWRNIPRIRAEMPAYMQLYMVLSFSLLEANVIPGLPDVVACLACGAKHYRKSLISGNTIGNYMLDSTNL